MSTVKIKTEPTAAATVVDVQVKLEPSLSAADIELEQHTSDIGTKLESDSEADSEKDDIKSENDGDSDNGQNQFTITPKNVHKFRCDHPGCNRRSNISSHIRMHQHEHRLQTKLGALGKTYTLTRQSLDERWACPVPGCTSTAKTIDSIRSHIRTVHSVNVRQQKHHHHPAVKTRYKHSFLDVDDFYVNSVRCGYHNTIGVFICHECRLVPESLLTHLQQKHGFNEKSIDNSTLPDSAIGANADPSINQHTSNTHLAAAIREPSQLHHQDIVQGWLCLTSDCGYCGYTARNQGKHRNKIHNGEQISTVPALVLRVAFSKSNSSYFFITRLDQASGSVAINRNRVNRRGADYSHNEVDTHDENGDYTDQNETTDASNQQRQFVCDYDSCGLFFNSATKLSMHRREHKLEVLTAVLGNTFTLSRQSADDRWSCPVPDCGSTCKTVNVTRDHIHSAHLTSTKQKRVKSEDEDNNQQQQGQQIIKRRQQTIYYKKVDNFYVNGTKYGYHNTIGLFICYECKLVPECLLTHLQQKHAFDEKSIDNAFLPESARITGSDPNINQHTSNSLLTSAIREPSQQQHPDIVQGWLCVTSDCGYYGYTVHAKYNHKKYIHRSEQLSTVPALVLRLLYGKTQASCFLITRLDTTNSITKQFKLASQYKSEDDDGDGDELVLSDYSDEVDIY